MECEKNNNDKKIETLNSVNRLWRRLLHVSKTDRFFLATPLLLTLPLPQHLLKLWPSGAWRPGETKMAPL